MKKWLMAAAVVVLNLVLFIGVACGGGDEDEEGVKELKYGAGVPLTGVAASVGLAVETLLPMAAEDIGEFEVGGEQYRWKTVVEDNLISTAGGVASANKLIYQHGVDFMFQATDTSGIAAAQITEEIPMLLEIGPGSTSFFGPDLPHTFLTFLAWEVTIPALVDWLVTEHPEIKSVAVVSEETPSGEAQREMWQAASDYHGLELYHETAPAGTVEYFPIATKLIRRDPDVVIGGFGTALHQAMWDFGYDGFSISNWWEEPMARAAGWDKLAEKNRFGKGFMIYGLHPYAGMFPRLEAFAEEYERRSGTEIGPAAAWLMNDLYILTGALQQAGTVDDVEKIVEAMEGGTFDTLVGPMHFGLEEYIGTPHVGMWPVPIFEIVAESEYVVHKIYTADEAEAAFLEVLAAR